MSILHDIVKAKKNAVENRKHAFPFRKLENTPNFCKETISFKEHLLNPEKLGIIAEFKRRSPSKGIINSYADVDRVITDYQEAGASALSVLTEHDFFEGNDSDLIVAKNIVTIPIIRKDFIISKYQIAEAKSIGADAILLIAAILDKNQLSDYLNYAHSIGLEALIEVHDEKEFEKIPNEAQIVGINSRNLNTFDVNLDQTAKLLKMLPNDVIKVAESGIASIEDYMMLRKIGFDAFLMGEIFMRNANPGMACQNFICAVKNALLQSNA